MSGLLRGRVTAGGLGPERIADGIWRVQGNPGRCNVFFLEHEGGVVQFDAGGRCMLAQVRSALRRLGPLHEVVLGHGHTDHRGTAPYLGAPVRCHVDEVVDAQGSGGFRYWGERLAGLPQPRRFIHREILHPRFWDGGPVPIAGTLEEDDEVAGFRVVHLPGHAPGLIALVRERDRLALTSDAFYTIDEWGRDAAPHVPEDAWNLDTARAHAALARLAKLDLEVAWPGHGEPLRGDVGAALAAASR